MVNNSIECLLVSKCIRPVIRQYILSQWHRWRLLCSGWVEAIIQRLHIHRLVDIASCRWRIGGYCRRGELPIWIDLDRLCFLLSHRLFVVESGFTLRTLHTSRFLMHALHDWWILTIVFSGRSCRDGAESWLVRCLLLHWVFVVEVRILTRTLVLHVYIGRFLIFLMIDNSFLG